MTCLDTYAEHVKAGQPLSSASTVQENQDQNANVQALHRQVAYLVVLHSVCQVADTPAKMCSVGVSQHDSCHTTRSYISDTSSS